MEAIPRKVDSTLTSRKDTVSVCAYTYACECVLGQRDRNLAIL